jgi:heavy metal sensor kinase
VTALPIRIRLAAWYSAVVALTLIGFAFGMYLAIQTAIHKAVDNELASRLDGIHTFLWRHLPWQSGKELLQEFQEHSGLTPGGDLYDVMDEQHRWVYQPATMRTLGLEPNLPEGPHEDRYKTLKRGGRLVRVLTANVEVAKRQYTVRVATVITAVSEVLERLRWLALLVIPAIILCSGFGGYWLSGRAMAPIEEITRTARDISEQSLSRRLPLPGARDELRMLSETLNAMLSRLEDAFRRVVQFTSDASHELRTPVAIIRTTAELMQEQKRTVAEYEEANAQILAEAERTSNLIAELLTLARADSQAAELSFAEVNLCEVAREVIASAAALAESKEISLRSHIPAPAVTVIGDYNAIRRLTLIFLDNAIKYSAPGTDVLTSVCVQGSSAVIEVRDEGIGIAEQDITHIFERFYRADKARSREMGGAGLGLSIAKWIAKGHNAQIEVESALGKGSTFKAVFASGGNRVG